MAPPPRPHSKPQEVTTITHVTAHFLGTIQYKAATHDYDGNPLPTDQQTHSKVIAEDIASELTHSLAYEKPAEADYIQRIHDVTVQPADTLRYLLGQAAQITARHDAPDHGIDCTCDLDAQELVKQLATYATSDDS